MNINTQIPNWPEYTISTSGEVRRVVGACGAVVGKTLKWTILKNGYAKVALCRDSCRKEYLVHRLVALTYIGNAKGLDVCHFDGNKLNNNIENLRIDTRKGNMADQIRMGKTPKGEKCGSNKYSSEFVKSIKNKLTNGVSVTFLHNETGIPRPTLYGIKSGATWAWL
mgnify:CR=1 FL=1|tara:strand:+ start:842 stop:1342 length:501 start_codon:yes stop_codon:yes gene_type:complete